MQQNTPYFCGAHYLGMLSASNGDSILHKKISRGMQFLPLVQLLQCVRASRHLGCPHGFSFAVATRLPRL